MLPGTDRTPLLLSETGSRGSPFRTSIRSYPFVDEEGGFVQRAAFHFLLLSKHQTEYVGCCGSRTSGTLACGKGMDRLHTN